MQNLVKDRKVPDFGSAFLILVMKFVNDPVNTVVLVSKMRLPSIEQNQTNFVNLKFVSTQNKGNYFNRNSEIFFSN